MPFSSQQKKSPRKQTRLKERESVCASVAFVYAQQQQQQLLLKAVQNCIDFPPENCPKNLLLKLGCTTLILVMGHSLNKKFYPRKRARKPAHFPRTRIPKRCRFHCTARLQPNPREFRRPLWRPTRRVRELFRERRFAFALPMPVRVDSSFFLCNARAPHHDDEDRCDQRRQEISSNIHPTNVSARDFIVL